MRHRISGRCRWLFFPVLAGFLLASVASLVPAHAHAHAAASPPKLDPAARKHLHVVSPNYYYCDAGWVYDNVTSANPSTNFVAVTPPYSDTNGTGSNATATFSATVTGTVTLSTTLGGSVDANAIVAGVETDMHITVSASISTTIGNAISITVPPGKTGYGQYGVIRQVTNGHYYWLDERCNDTDDLGIVKAYSPWSPNWQTWIQ